MSHELSQQANKDVLKAAQHSRLQGSKELALICDWIPGVGNDQVCLFRICNVLHINKEEGELLKRSGTKTTAAVLSNVCLSVLPEQE